MSKTSAVLLVLLVFSHAASHADPATVAFANLKASNRLQQQKPLIESIDTAAAGHTFLIQQNHSMLRLQVDSPIGDVWINIDDFRGSFSIRRDGNQESVAVIEVDANSLESDRLMVETILKGESFLDVANFPSVQFVGDNIEWYGQKYAVLTGYMTIRNITRKIAFYVQRIHSAVDEAESDRIHMKATATIRRSEFGIHTLIPLVSDNVNLHIDIEAIRNSPENQMMMSAK